MTVSLEDRARWARQVAALAAEPEADELTPAQRWDYLQWVAAERERLGLPELQTEGEVHWLARRLGLLDDDPRPAGGARG